MNETYVPGASVVRERAILIERARKTHAQKASGMRKKSSSKREGYEKVMLQRLPGRLKDKNSKRDGYENKGFGDE